MSNYTRYYTDSDEKVSSELLRMAGPTLPVFIHIPDTLAVERAKSEKVTSPVSGLGLIDTGASASMVAESVIKELGLNPIGKKTVITPGGTGLMDSYPAKFSFPGTDLPALEFNSVLSSPHLPIGKYNVIALIGRDILKHGVLIYNGDGHICLGLNPNKQLDKGSISVEQQHDQ
jgi:hypothetical protein